MHGPDDHLGFGFSLPLVAAWWQLYRSPVVLNVTDGVLDISQGSTLEIRRRSEGVRVSGFIK